MVLPQKDGGCQLPGLHEMLNQQGQGAEVRGLRRHHFKKALTREGKEQKKGRIIMLLTYIREAYHPPKYREGINRDYQETTQKMVVVFHVTKPSRSARTGECSACFFSPHKGREGPWQKPSLGGKERVDLRIDPAELTSCIFRSSGLMFPRRPLSCTAGSSCHSVLCGTCPRAPAGPSPGEGVP